MRLKFTKMQGAGNDFVVLDGTRAPLNLSTAQLQHLGDRRFGVGADQILLVEPADAPGVDFRYRIFNGASGAEVEHCGNGARCFVRYVRGHGLTDARQVRVQTVNRVLDLTEQADGRVTVDMGVPEFEPGPMFETLALGAAGDGRSVQVMLLSMGNPHAVQRVDDVDTAPVLQDGPLIERHARFPQGVNAGFLQVLSRHAVRLRVFERDAGETLACGTGACAAVVAGIRAGWLDARVDVALRGGQLSIEWHGDHVFMTGPAETVFEGEIEL
ncbi:MAG: diaminopimelate epimerase [Rubrivivax sp.]|nr:diaminopimelate epimerase [Rubrivivax sp.]